MKRISSIGGLLKKIYRLYNNQLLSLLQEKGFTDLRPSFLEILIYICENQGPTIKEVGTACGLKKQTMTSHLNELQKRGYVSRKPSDTDKREQLIFLTEYGERFKFSLLEALGNIEAEYTRTIGDLELDRINSTLENMHEKVTPSSGDDLKSRVQLNLSLDF